MGVETLERELKLRMVSKAQWRELLDRLGEPTAVLNQANTYFQNDHIREALTMVRVRRVGDEAEITVKDRVVSEGAQLEARERTWPYNESAWAEVTAELGCLVAIGEMRNERRVFDLGSGYLAEVDRTELPGGRVDYEIEVELRSVEHTFEGARSALRSAAGASWIDNLRPSTPKFARFMEALKADSAQGT